MNILEAVDISIAGGMSVDYVLHLAHSYNSQTGDHADKVREWEGRLLDIVLANPILK